MVRHKEEVMDKDKEAQRGHRVFRKKIIEKKQRGKEEEIIYSTKIKKESKKK